MAIPRASLPVLLILLLPCTSALVNSFFFQVALICISHIVITRLRYNVTFQYRLNGSLFPKQWGQLLTLLPLRKSLPLAHSRSSRKSWVTSKSWKSISLCFPGSGWQTCTSTPGFFMWGLKTKLIYSRVCGKHSTKRTIPGALSAILLGSKGCHEETGLR